MCVKGVVVWGCSRHPPLPRWPRCTGMHSCYCSKCFQCQGNSYLCLPTGPRHWCLLALAKYLPPANGLGNLILSVLSLCLSVCPQQIVSAQDPASTLPFSLPPLPLPCSNLFNLHLNVQGFPTAKEAGDLHSTEMYSC